MFNWVARKGIVATRNIRDIMSRSKKKTPASTCCCCKSQKRGKQFCNRKFRRHERMMIGKGQYKLQTRGIWVAMAKLFGGSAPMKIGSSA